MQLATGEGDTGHHEVAVHLDALTRLRQGGLIDRNAGRVLPGHRARRDDMDGLVDPGVATRRGRHRSDR